MWFFCICTKQKRADRKYQYCCMFHAQLHMSLRFNGMCLIANYLSLLNWLIRLFLCVLYYSVTQNVKQLEVLIIQIVPIVEK
jgi:hypothetical protein